MTMASLRPDDQERLPFPLPIDGGSDLLANVSDDEEEPPPRRDVGRARSPTEGVEESPRRVRVVAAAGRQDEQEEESSPLQNDERARSEREGDDGDGEESLRPVRVVLVDNLMPRGAHDDDQVGGREREGDEEETVSRPLDIVAQMARGGDEEVAVGVARMAAREADEDETIAIVRARLRRGEIDAHTRLLARFVRSITRFQRVVRNRALAPSVELLRQLDRGGDEDEAFLELLQQEELFEGLELEERRMRFIDWEERRMFQERALDRLPDWLLEDWFEAGDDFLMRPWPLRENRVRDRPVLPQEPSRPPAHIQEYENFNRAAGMTFAKAAEGVELATASPNFDPSELFLKRVTACIGWAVHGLIFEFVNGKRMGAILVDFGDRSLNLSDESIEKRAGVGWTDIDFGDYIVGMHGDRLADPGKMWFCHTLVLQFYSGKSIRYEAKHEPWRGLPFAYTVPQPCLVYRIAFKYEQGEDILGLKTSFHLPIKQGNMAHLPPKYKTCVKEIVMMGRKIDSDRESSGEKPLGDDVWWRILSMLHGWQLLPQGPIEEEEEASSESCSVEEQNREGGESGSVSQRGAERGRRSWFRGWGPPPRRERERSRGRLGSF